MFMQPKITGYRQLTSHEAALMNEAKAIGAQFEDLIAKVRDWHNAQADLASARQVADSRDGDEFARLVNAEPGRWLAMGRTDIQTGVMKIVRSIAQPAS
jgi:xanthine dehydrogenase iron-sulfur cluster and FAD-binding subunit A